MYQVDNAKGQVYNLRTLGNVRIRLTKLKKGCIWGFVANEDHKEEKEKKNNKKAECAKVEEQLNKVKDKKKEKAKLPKSALKKPKMEKDVVVVQIKPMRKAPRKIKEAALQCGRLCIGFACRAHRNREALQRQTVLGQLAAVRRFFAVGCR